MATQDPSIERKQDSTLPNKSVADPKADHQKTANVMDREERSKGQRGDPEDYNRHGYAQKASENKNSEETMTPAGKEWLANREKERQERQEKLTKLEEKWNSRVKESESEQDISDEDLELFKRVAGARKLYREIKNEVEGVDMGSPDIDSYRNLRSLAYSEYMTLFNQLVGTIQAEFN